MKNKNFILAIIFTTFTVASCSSEVDKNIESATPSPAPLEQVKSDSGQTVEQNFREKFAGSYTIEMKDVPSSQFIELYALHENGKASWLHLESDGTGNVETKSKKIGTWVATANEITINIQGNTGTITEIYEEKNNILKMKDMPSKFLKKTD